jgi:hypothetical protein
LCSDAELPTSRDFKAICAAIPESAPIIAEFVRNYKAAPDCDLWVLNQLDRIDKHRSVTHTLVQSSGMTVAIKKEHEGNPPPIEPGAIYGIPREQIDGVWTPEEELRPGSKAYEHNQKSGYTIVKIRFGEVIADQEVIPKLWHLVGLVSGLIEKLDETIFRLEATP